MNLSKENLAVFSRTARRFTSRADAVEDIAQQAVLAILEALKKNPEKLEGMEPKRAEAYMRGTVRNCARKAHHQEKKRQERENELSTLPPDAGEVMEVHHKSHILLGLIAELPDEQRDRIWAIVGAYPSTLEEVAEYLGIHAPALRQSLRRIRRNLRERMIAIGGIVILAVAALKAFAFMTTRQDNPESLSGIADVEPSDNYQKDSGFLIIPERAQKKSTQDGRGRSHEPVAQRSRAAKDRRPAFRPYSGIEASVDDGILTFIAAPTTPGVVTASAIPEGGPIVPSDAQVEDVARIATEDVTVPRSNASDNAVVFPKPGASDRHLVDAYFAYTSGRHGEALRRLVLIYYTSGDPRILEIIAPLACEVGNSSWFDFAASRLPAQIKRSLAKQCPSPNTSEQ